MCIKILKKVVNKLNTHSSIWVRQVVSSAAGVFDQGDELIQLYSMGE
jgi:hypothetical protein